MTTNKTLSLIIVALVVIISAMLAWVLVPESTDTSQQEPVSSQAEESMNDINTTKPSEEGPLYFIAIHNEPNTGTFADTEADIEHEFGNLTSMIESADAQNVKLTLMFSAQWVDVILNDPTRAQLVEKWEANGHEIAGHHHSTSHGTWDGYSPLAEEAAIKTRFANGKDVPEPHLGDMDDYAQKLTQLNPDFHSGCMNDSEGKDELPDSVIYDTCSGFSILNGKFTSTNDNDGAFIGDNQYIISAPVNGIQRYWLNHYLASNPQKAGSAVEYLSGMSNGVYGVVLHSSDNNQEAFNALIQQLKEFDSDGSQSRTLSEIIDGETLPIYEATEEEIRS